jgi:hypothetical protein
MCQQARLFGAGVSMLRSLHAAAPGVRHDPVLQKMIGLRAAYYQNNSEQDVIDFKCAFHI